jgi:hypothetical protein
MHGIIEFAFPYIPYLLQEYLTRVDELIRDKHGASLEAKSNENKEKELVAQSNMYV